MFKCVMGFEPTPPVWKTGMLTVNTIHTYDRYGARTRITALKGL